MNEVIPGGRQRASSESDVLDEHVVKNVENHSLTLDHKHFSRSYGNHLSDHINSDEEFAGSEKGYFTLQPKGKRRNKPLFKSVKKIVNRLRRNYNGKSSSDVSEDMNGGKGGNKNESHGTQPINQMATIKRCSDSSSRPLITRPQSVSFPWKVCPGTVGIQNHGNTCFMNAILQCLSNTDAVTGYFVTKQHKTDIKSKGFSKKFSNAKNDLTESFCSLLEHLWSNTYSPEVSSSFKNTVGKYNSQYKGRDQHDAQEFLLWFLDSINEELAATAKKKHKVFKGKDNSDESLADEVLNNSNGCPFYNLFQALYRSSLQCPNCNKQSNTFESYICLSLPLPNKTKRPVFVTIVYLDGNPRQRKVGVEINIQDSVRELRETLAENMQVPFSQLVLCQIYEDGFRCTFSDDQPISDISETEMIYALETLPVPESDLGEQSPYLQLIVVHTTRESNSNKYQRFSPPEILNVSRDADFKMLQMDILNHMSDCVKEGLLNQKLNVLFKLRVVDGSAGKGYLPQDVEMPLLTSIVERALSMWREEYGPQHLKLVAEWESAVKAKVIWKDNNDIDEHDSYRRLRHSSQQPYKVSLNGCLQLFTKEETLSGDDAWNCPHCHKQQQAATKTIGLWSLPNVLVIHLKRFRQVGLRRNKLKTFVDFPVKGLDISDHILQRSPYNTDNQIYDLYGVCNHYGDMQGGHYTAYCKNPLDEKWYEFDDSKVRPMSEAEIKTSSAYLLFYQKKGTSLQVLEALQNRNHWVFKLNPSLLTVTSNEVQTVHNHSPEDQSLTAGEEKGGLFSRSGSGRSDLSSRSEEKLLLAEKHNAHGGATGHVSSKLVHNSSNHTVSPEGLQTALSQTSESRSDKPNSVLKSLDVNLKVKLPPSTVTKQNNISDKPPSGRSSMYDRQNAGKPVKNDTPPELPVKTYLNSAGSATQKNNVDPSNSSLDKRQYKEQSDLPSRASTEKRQYSDHKTVPKLQQKNEENDKRWSVRDPSPQQSRRLTDNSPSEPRRPTSNNWSTPQPPRKTTSSQHPKSPFQRQNSTPIKRSQSTGRNYSRLSSSRSDEDLSFNRDNRRSYDDSTRPTQGTVVPSNKGIHELINNYNTISKKVSPTQTLDTRQSRADYNPTQTSDTRQSRADYKRTISYQNAKNYIIQNQHIGQEGVSKPVSNSDVYLEKKKPSDTNRPDNHYTKYSPEIVSPDNRMPKSKTEDNLVLNTPGSRKPVYQPSQSESDDNIKRYKPQKHYVMPKKTKSFKKEKMYSPCMKESSV